MAPHIHMTELEQRRILQQRTLHGHRCRMTFYDAYLDVLDKAKQDAKYWAATVHGKDLRLVKVSCGFFREEIPMFERVRYRMLWLVEWSVFENFVIILIICNALVMAHPVAYDEASQPRGVQNTYFVFETLVSAVFTIECLCRIIAQGLFFGDAPNPCYLKEPSNWIDMIVVIFTFVEPFAAEVISEQDLRTMRVLRIFRVFRVIRGMTFLPRLRTIVQSLSKSLYRLWISSLAITFTLIVVSMAGTDLFGDVYWRRCRLSDEPYVLNGTLVWPLDPDQPRFCGGRYECVPTASGAPTYCRTPVRTDTGPLPGYNPWPELFENPLADYGFTGYQTLWSGLLTTFQVVNIDGWSSIMHRFEDAKWPGLTVPFFILLVLFGGLILMNLVLAILWHSFDTTVQEDRSELGDSKLQLEAKRMHPKPIITPDIQQMPLHALVSSVQQLEVELAAAQAFQALDTEFRSMGLKNICYSMITSPWFGRVMNFIILFNALCMCFDIYPPYDDTVLLILDNINFLCSVIFFFEVCIKIMGVGVSFFEDNGNRFDFLLVMLSVVELFLSGGSALSALRTARLLRIFRMIHMSMNFRILLMVFQKAVTPTLYFSMIVILFLYCSCLAGLQIFNKDDVASGKLGLGFESLAMGFLTSLAIFSGDGWLDITTQQIQGKDNQLFGFFYFLLTFALGKAVLKNLLLGIIAAEFTVARDIMKQDFRLRMAIARAKLDKLRLIDAASGSTPGRDKEEAEDDVDVAPESPRWPQQAFSRLEGTADKTCARNMDVIKMIHVKGQAAKRLQAIGKIHAMGKSKYSWPKGERHPPDPGMTDVEAMFHSSVEMQSDALHRAAPPESPGMLRLQREAYHGAAPPDEPEAAVDAMAGSETGFICIQVESAGISDPKKAKEQVQVCSAPREHLAAFDRPGSSEPMQPFTCLPVWDLEPIELSTYSTCGRKETFVESYRRARAARAGLQEDTELSSASTACTARAYVPRDVEAPRRRVACRENVLHWTMPPQRKEVKLEETPQVIGEEVLLSQLEDLPDDEPVFHREALTSATRNGAPPPDDKPSITELLRGCARSIMRSHGFEPIVMFVICLSSVSLAFESPFSDPNSEVAYLQMVIDRFSVMVMLLEMFVRMMVMGLWKHPSECGPGELPGYFRVPWHVLDFVICLGGLTYLIAEMFAAGLAELRSVRALKMISMLRPLRLIGKTSSVRLIIESLLAAIPTLINMTMVSALFYLGFALLFVGFFKGALYHCSLDPQGDLMPEIVTKKDCLKAGGEWINSESHFDAVTYSLVALLHIGSGEGWIDVTLNIIGAQGVELQPRPKSKVEQAIPVVIFMALTNFFLLNLLTGILVDSYTSTKAEFSGQSNNTSEERLIKKLQREVLLNPEVLLPPPRIDVRGKCCLATRQRLRWFIEHRISRSVIFVGILSNAIVLGISPVIFPDLLEFRRIVSGLLLGLFAFELAIKIFVYSRDFFKDKWHAYDSFAITGSLIGALVNALVSEKGVMTQILGGFQILRILMLVRYAWFMDSITSTIWVALPGLFQVSALLTLLMFMYACLGVSLFGTMMSADEAAMSASDGIYPLTDTNFYSFNNAFLLMIRCATGERWHDIMYDLAEDKPNCTTAAQTYEDLVQNGPRGCGSMLAYPYFVSYVLIVLFNMMNLIIATVLDAYGQVHELIELEDFMVCLRALRDAWVEIDRNFLGYLHVAEVENILLSIPQPVGFIGLKKRQLLRSLMNLQVHEGSMLAYRDVIKLVAQRSVLFLSGELLLHPQEAELDEQALRTWNAAFPELPPEPPSDAILIAHIVIARRTAVYIRKKRWEWKQRSRSGQGAMRSLKKAAANRGLDTRARSPRGSPRGSPKGSPRGSPRSGSPRSGSPRSGSPAGSEGKDEVWEEAMYNVDVDIDTALAGVWEQSDDPGPPTSIFVSQLAPSETAQAQRSRKLPQLSPLRWPPEELVKYQPEEEPVFTNAESSMWAKVADLAQGKGSRPTWKE
ncbi:NaCP60E [Symbiodinium natans]|uniref:NaCP60E protein n=1 Tax=Symbiodinium natans TaxID=878477 RepID=A0A812T486_9DINO|nr:NaCP60E [Symbiodinium natans]